MKNNKKGFTLVELVIVIAVIAILAAVLIPTFSGIIERARENTKMQRATSARDELLHLENVSSVEDLKNFLIKIDDTYYIIGDNGSVTNLGDNLEDIIEQKNISYSVESSILMSDNTTAFVPLNEGNGSGVVDNNSETNAEDDDILDSAVQTLTWQSLIDDKLILVDEADPNNKILVCVSYDVKELVIDDSIKGIAYTAFVSNNLTKITIPASVKDYYAYSEYCLPDVVMRHCIGDSTSSNSSKRSDMYNVNSCNYFDWLQNYMNGGNSFNERYHNYNFGYYLESITVKPGNKNFYSDGNGLYYNNAIIAFTDSANVSSYEIKSNITLNGQNITINEIAPLTFYTGQYDNLNTDIIIPDSIYEISYRSFAPNYCTYGDGNEILYIPKDGNPYYFALRNQIRQQNNNYPELWDNECQVHEDTVVIASGFFSNEDVYYENGSYANRLEVPYFKVGPNLKYISSGALTHALINEFVIDNENNYFKTIKDDRILLNNVDSYGNVISNGSRMVGYAYGIDIEREREYLDTLNISAREMDNVYKLDLSDTDIVEICDNAFMFNYIIREISLPSTLKKIGKGAFMHMVDKWYANPDNQSLENYADLCEQNGVGAKVGEYVQINFAPASSGIVVSEYAFYNYDMGDGNESEEEEVRINSFAGIAQVNDFAFYNTIIHLDQPEELESDYIYNIDLTSVSKIGKHAFENLRTSAETQISVEIQNNTNLKVIEENGLNIHGLLSVTIPKNVEYIGMNIVPSYIQSFNIDEQNTTYSSDTNGALYKGTTFVDILTKEKIYDEFAFKDGTTIISSWGEFHSAFDGVSVRRIVLPNSVVKIDTDAISGMVDMEEIVLNEGLKYIAPFAIYIDQNTNNVETITIPASVEFVGSCGIDFAGDLTLQSPNMVTNENKDYIYNSETGELVYVAPWVDNFTTEETGITVIPDYAFKNSNMNGVVLKDVTSIGAYAFENSNINYVVLSTALKTISPYTFANSNIQNFYIYEPEQELMDKDASDEEWDAYDAIVSKDVNSQIAVINNSCLLNKTTGELFYIAPNLTEFSTVGTGIKILPDYAFIKSPDLTEVNLAGVEQIGNYIFKNTMIYTSEVTLPSSAKKVANNAFELDNADGFTVNVFVESDSQYFGNDENYLVVYNKQTGKIIHQNTIEFAYKNLGFDDINNVAWEDTIKFTTENTTIKEIPSYMFKGDLTQYITGLNLVGVEKINDFAFVYFDYVTSVELPASLKEFSNFAFAGLFYFASENDQPVSLTVNSENPYFAVYNGAIYTKDYKKLIYVPSFVNEIELHEQTEVIGKYAAYNAQQLEKVFTNNKLTTIEEYAFYGSGIFSFVFPATLTHVDSYAFANCEICAVFFEHTSTVNVFENSVNVFKISYNHINNLDEKPVIEVYNYYDNNNNPFVEYQNWGKDNLDGVYYENNNEIDKYPDRPIQEEAR